MVSSQLLPRKGESNWRQSCDREVGFVRNTVGVCDVSTLGKIDIQGPDAAKLLDFAYTNMFSTLKVGRVRYGLMLREDGFVMDDGTTARLGETHYVMTTTTAAAGLVMRHLEFITQVHHPEWDVRIMSVTEQWAQFAIAGPKSRDLVNGLIETPIDNESWPFMACGPVRVAGIDARLFRISFSGEHAYELAVPARYGDALFRVLVKRAEALAGGAYGMEALTVLRVEKGHITHSEIHGRTTAFDVGMERMISANKDCIGKTMAARDGLLEDDREQMVGFKPTGAIKKLTAGAHLYTEGADAVPDNDQGYVTSAAFSPDFGHYIALGFVRGGAARHGDRLRLVDAMRGIDTVVEVCPLCLLTPKEAACAGNDMADTLTLTATSPCYGLLPKTVGTCTLTETDLGTLTSVAPFKGRAVSDALKGAHGMAFPAPNRVTGKDGARAIWFGRDMVLLAGPVPDPGLGDHAALTDQSDAWTCVTLSGRTRVRFWRGWCRLTCGLPHSNKATPPARSWAI